jgi:hypothetical protein
MKTHVYTFVITSCQILPRMSNVSEESYRENQKTNFIFQKLYHLKMWKNKVQPDRHS